LIDSGGNRERVLELHATPLRNVWIRLPGARPTTDRLLRLPQRVLDRALHLGITGAATQVAVHVGADLFGIGLVFLEQVESGQDHAGRAVTALSRPVIGDGLLKLCNALVGPESVQSRDMGAVGED